MKKIYFFVWVFFVSQMFPNGNISAQNLPTRITGLSENSPFGLGFRVEQDIADEMTVGQNIGVKWVRGTQKAIIKGWDKNSARSEIMDWKNHGIYPLLTFFYPDDLMRGPGISPPKDFDVYATRCYNFVNDFNDLTRYYEHWNEPWINEWAWNGGTAQEYRDMIKLVWDKVRANSAFNNVELIGGGSVSFNRDVLYAKGATNAGYATGSISHAYGFPEPSQFGVTAVQMALDKKYAQNGGRAGAWQTELGTKESDFTADNQNWVAKTVAPTYLMQMLAAKYASQQVRVFWFSYGQTGFSGDAYNIYGKQALNSYKFMTLMLEGTTVVEDVYPNSKGLWGVLVKDANGIGRAAIWTGGNWPSDISVPTTEYSGTLSLSGSGIKAYDYLGNEQTNLSSIQLNPYSVIFINSNITSDNLKTILQNANFTLNQEIKVNPLSFTGLVVKGRTIDIKLENTTNKNRSMALTVTPPSGWTLDANNIRIENLAPGEKRIIQFSINAFNVSADNKYAISYSLAIDGKGTPQTGNQVVQVAYAPKKTMTIDANLNDWSSIPATTMANGTYTFRTAWDDNYLYVAAEVTDDTPAGYPTWSSMQNDPSNFVYCNKDGVFLNMDVTDNNPDDILKGHPLYEKACGSEVDYEYMLNYAGSSTPELLRYRAPGTNMQSYYPTTASLSPPLGGMNVSASGGSEGKMQITRNGNKTVYELALAWNAVPELKTKLSTLTANQDVAINLAWRVNGGNSGMTFWTNESGQAEDGAYGFSPTWQGGKARNGGRVNTRWNFVNGDGSIVNGGCTGIAVTGISVNPTTISLSTGNTATIATTITPSNACNQTVSWSSSNTAIATVSSSGLVTGVTAGTATITVTTADGNKTATSAITVNALTGGCTATGTILYQRWDGISGVAVSDLTSNANYPNSPTSSSSLTSFEAATDVADNYGARIAGYICAPSSGSYTFWIASDDNSQLWLSTDANASNKVKIAEVTDWTDSRQWGKFASQKSVAISLTQGQTYYVEALMKEGSGGDNLAVGWAKPGQSIASPSEVIPGSVLSPLSIGNVVVTGVTVNPTSASINVGATTTLTANVLPSNATNPTVSWSSSNTAVATVSSSGLVKGVTAGTATITVTTADGNKTATSAITVNTVTGGCSASGTILYQRWDGISGTAVSDLTSNANYPNSPTSSSSLTSMEAGTNVADNYGARIAGYICAPATGAYTFWIASDDASQLWLSTDGTASNKVKIAEVTSWTNSREWGKQTSQKSATINLTQGQSYYMEALMKEGAGGDNLAVGWLKPGQSGTAPSEVVPGSVLSPLVVGTTSITKVYEAENGSVSGGAQVQNATNASGGKTVGNINANNAYNQVNSVDGGAGGTASLVIRFANGSGGTKSLSLYVNNTKVQQVVFATTSSWNTFADQPAINIPLNAGTGNTIKIQKDAADTNAADIDKYTVTTGAAKSAEQPIENDAVSANSTISVFPNPCDGNEITISGVVGQVTISITDLSGRLVYQNKLMAYGTLSVNQLNLSKGLYIMLINNNGTTVKKLVVN